MIDIKLIRENVDAVISNLQNRGGDFSYLKEVKDLDEKRRNLLVDVEDLKKTRNETSKLIGKLKREKKDPTEVLKSVANLGDEITKLDIEIEKIESKIENYLLNTPNLLSDDVPFGTSEENNLEIKKYLEPKKFSFEPKSHYELGEKLDILDFSRAAKITGSRFVVYKGLGARLERALINFMMDLHAEKGYREIIPPYIVNRVSMTATGQLPKFEEDAFKLVNNPDWFLNPTAEVPTINLYRDEILSADDLPQYFVGYTMAFRSEAGSAGRDTRGLIRTHQFNKVELIKFTTPETSTAEHDAMLADSERVLQLLNIPYRVVVLCSGDIGFGMAKTYDIEVWIPSQNTYREIGSISNALDYQARRGNIRFRRDKNAKPEYVHTLNGSGLAVGRTLVAILENYQNEDGSITIPEKLIPYMGTDIIK
ncbi:MAG TPA: serine--tRNA ligase [Acholeplasmataceae bacterium]|jgi:seryl-tRNA synthetase|nr:serine--tRNA ligase [Acholeplasmataceae bacterium]